MVRILVAAFFLTAVTLCFLDFTGAAARWFGWTAKLQLMPAALALSVVAAAVVAVTLVFGRVYCSMVCPLGILQDVAVFFRRLFGFKFRPASHDGVAVLVRRIVRLSTAAIFFAGGFLGLHFTWLEPYAIYGRMSAALAAPLVRLGNNRLALWAERQGSDMFCAVEVAMPPLCIAVLSVAMLLLIVALALWRGRLWCNTVCPVGAVLGFVSRFSIFKPAIDPARCVKCRLCEKACKARCIDVAHGTIDRSSCVACFDCGAACGKGALTWSR